MTLRFITHTNYLCLMCSLTNELPPVLPLKAKVCQVQSFDEGDRGNGKVFGNVMHFIIINIKCALK